MVSVIIKLFLTNGISRPYEYAMFECYIDIIKLEALILILLCFVIYFTDIKEIIQYLIQAELWFQTICNVFI